MCAVGKNVRQILKNLVKVKANSEEIKTALATARIFF